MAIVNGPAVHFDSIDSLLLSLLYGPSLKSVHEWLMEKLQLWFCAHLSEKQCLCLTVTFYNNNNVVFEHLVISYQRLVSSVQFNKLRWYINTDLEIIVKKEYI